MLANGYTEVFHRRKLILPSNPTAVSAIQSNKIRDLLHSWITSTLEETAIGWVESQSKKIASGDQKTLFLAFGLASRKTSKTDLKIGPEELAKAVEVRPNWQPVGWTIDQLVRTYFVLTYPNDDADDYVATLDKLFASGEVHELIALYSALPLLPQQDRHVERAAEGIRTNMKSVFCAVAHHNAYPMEQLDENSWNQMVLKCLFIGVPLYPVVGLDERANSQLTRMLCDYAHERWAAKRAISPELWRPVGACVDEGSLSDLQKVLVDGTEIEQQAAALALFSCESPEAGDILKENESLAEKVRSGKITWSAIANQL